MFLPLIRKRIMNGLISLTQNGLRQILRYEKTSIVIQNSKPSNKIVTLNKVLKFILISVDRSWQIKRTRPHITKIQQVNTGFVRGLGWIRAKLSLNGENIEKN